MEEEKYQAVKPLPVKLGRTCAGSKKKNKAQGERRMRRGISSGRISQKHTFLKDRTSSVSRRVLAGLGGGRRGSRL